MNYDPVTRWLAAAAVILLGVILVWIGIATTSGPSINDRLDRIENQLAYVSCLLLITPEDRIPEVVAGCQVFPVDSTSGG